MIRVSAKTGEGLPRLEAEILRRLSPDAEEFRVRIPYTSPRAIAAARAAFQVLDEKDQGDALSMRLSGERRYLRPLAPFVEPRVAATSNISSRRESPDEGGARAAGAERVEGQTAVEPHPASRAGAPRRRPLASSRDVQNKGGIGADSPLSRHAGTPMPALFLAIRDYKTRTSQFV